MSKRFIAKLVALFGIAFFVLNSCGKTPSESPDAVINKFKTAIKNIDAADFSVSADMTGKESTDNINFDLNADAKVDRLDEKRNADVSVKLGGALDAQGQKLDGNLNIRIVTVGDEFYFNLSQFDTTDPNTEKIETALKPYMSKWEHISSDFIPQNIKDLQKNDPDSQKKQEQLKDLFISTKLFDVSKEYGVEKLDGNNVYHYGIKLDKDGVKDYIKKASVISGTEKTDQEVEDAATFVDSVSDLELWIGADDYFLYKGVATLTGSNADNNATSSITITYTAKSYNKDLGIKTPEGSEEFNPISLLMGLQLGQGTTAPSGTPDDTQAPGSTVTPPADTTAPTATAPSDTTKPADTSAPADTTTTEKPADTSANPAK